MNKIMHYNLAGLLSMYVLTGFAANEVTDPLVFVEPMPFIPAEINAGDTVPVQYTIKNQGTTSTLNIYPDILNESGVSDDSIVFRVNIGTGQDCGPSGSLLAPQQTCTLTYNIFAPSDVDAVHHTLLIETNIARSGYELSSDIKFKVGSSTPTARLAYVVNSTAPTSVMKCTIDSSGVFTGCPVTNGGNAFGPVDIAFATVSGTPYAYITKANYMTGNPGRVNKCVVTSNGDLGSCTQTGNFSGQTLTGIAFHTAGSTLYAYLAETGANKLLRCPVLSTGFLPACTDLGITVNSPQFITFGSFGGKTYAYVGTQATTGSENLRKCEVNSSGAFINCGVAFNFPLNLLPIPTEKVSFATVSGIHYAYVTLNTADFILKCEVDTATGNLHSCFGSGAGLYNGPQSIAHATINGTQYNFITHKSAARIDSCEIIDNAGNMACADSGVGAVFSGPRGIAIR